MRWARRAGKRHPEMRNAGPGCCPAPLAGAADPGPMQPKTRYWVLGPGSAAQREERCTASGTREYCFTRARPDAPEPAAKAPSKVLTDPPQFGMFPARP